MTLGIAVVLAAVVEIGVSTYFQSRSQIIDNRVSGTYASLSELIANNSVTFPNKGSQIPLADTLRTSLSQGNTNQQLANCIIGSLVAACQNGIPQPLTLFYPILQSSGQPIMSGPGPAGAAGSSPARFDVYGNPCQSATWTKRCPFEIYSQFVPSCGGPAVCSRAVSISVHFQLRGPRGGSYLTGDGSKLPVLDLVSSAINVSAILPPTPTQAAQAAQGNVQVQQFTSSDSSSTSTNAIDWSKVNPAIVAGLYDNGKELPAATNLIIDGLTKSGVTDPTILKALASSWIDEVEFAQKMADGLIGAQISDPNVMGVVIQGLILDTPNRTNVGQYGEIATQLAASGVSFTTLNAQTTLGFLIHYGVTDITTLTAMYNSLESVGELGWSYAAKLVAEGGATTPAQVAAIIEKIKSEPSSGTDTESTTVSLTDYSSGGSSEYTPGSPAPLAPPPIKTLNTCSGSQCLNAAY